MPVSLEQAITTMNDVSSFSDKAIQYIDENLSDARWMRNSVRNKDTNPTFHFAIEGNATQGDKDRIVREYTAVGWGNVTVRNSDENNERPGMVGIFLEKQKINKADTSN